MENPTNANTKKILIFIVNEIIYGGHIQCFSALSIIFLSAILLKIKITLDILIIVYLMFYAFYLYNRFKEIHIDSSTNPQRTKHLKTYLKLIPFILYFIIITLFISLIYFSNIWVLIFSLFLFALGILYTVSFKKITKNVALFKNIYVSIFFALLPLYLLIYYSPLITNFLITATLTLSLFIFLKTFIIQIFLDIKDIESDRKEGLITFPVVFGKEKTLKFLSLANTLIILTIPIFFSLYLNIFPKSILMIIFAVPFSLYCYDLARKQKYFGYILQSGEYVLWAILILVGKILL
ncbi:MAG TPA: hypothetical protein ENL27_02320 [Candidatus Parcubacteria bacterium]|nr:hypothetical protein [Candidatus Parcubacteria bacterium]